MGAGQEVVVEVVVGMTGSVDAAAWGLVHPGGWQSSTASERTRKRTRDQFVQTQLHSKCIYIAETL